MILFTIVLYSSPINSALSACAGGTAAGAGTLWAVRGTFVGSVFMLGDGVVLQKDDVSRFSILFLSLLSIVTDLSETVSSFKFLRTTKNSQYYF